MEVNFYVCTPNLSFVCARRRRREERETQQLGTKHAHCVGQPAHLSGVRGRQVTNYTVDILHMSIIEDFRCGVCVQKKGM